MDQAFDSEVFNNPVPSESEMNFIVPDNDDLPQHVLIHIKQEPCDEVEPSSPLILSDENYQHISLQDNIPVETEVGEPTIHKNSAEFEPEFMLDIEPQDGIRVYDHVLADIKKEALDDEPANRTTPIVIQGYGRGAFAQHENHKTPNNENLPSRERRKQRLIMKTPGGIATSTECPPKKHQLKPIDDPSYFLGIDLTDLQKQSLTLQDSIQTPPEVQLDFEVEETEMLVPTREPVTPPFKALKRKGKTKQETEQALLIKEEAERSSEEETHDKKKRTSGRKKKLTQRAQAFYEKNKWPVEPTQSSVVPPCETLRSKGKTRKEMEPPRPQKEIIEIEKSKVVETHDKILCVAETKVQGPDAVSKEEQKSSVGSFKVLKSSASTVHLYDTSILAAVQPVVVNKQPEPPPKPAAKEMPQEEVIAIKCVKCKFYFLNTDRSSKKTTFCCDGCLMKS